MYEATAEANNQAAAQLGLEAYRKRMEAVCGAGKPFVALDILSGQHADARDLALRTFRERRKMGGQQFSQRYEAQLVEDIETLRSELEKSNESKSLMRVARTPITLLVVFLCSHLVDKVIEFVGLTLIDSLLDALGVVLMAAVSLWAYAKYAGRFSELANAIDTFAAMLFERLQTVLNSSATQAAMYTLSNQLQGQSASRTYEFADSATHRLSHTSGRPSASNSALKGNEKKQQ